VNVQRNKLTISCFTSNNIIKFYRCSRIFSVFQFCVSEIRNIAKVCPSAFYMHVFVHKTYSSSWRGDIG
jgi:hypothetical protein